MTKRASLRLPLAFTGIILGFFMALLDATIVNINLPEMAKTYGVDLARISWVMNGYNLAFAVAILTAARIADQFGRKRLFLIGTLAFIASSVGAAVAPNVDVLIAMRVLQGLAGAIMVPVTIPLAIDLIPAKNVGLVYGIWGAVAGLAAASGPALGGLLTSSFGWPSIFLVNVPLGLISLALSWVLLKESRDPSAGRKLDWAGMLTISAAMFSLVYALINGHDLGWTSPTMLMLFGASALFLAAFVVVELRGREPMLPVWILSNRRLMAASAGLLIMGLSIVGTVFLVSFWLRLSLGLSSLDAGLTVSIMPLVSILGSIIAGPRASRGDSRPWILGGTVVMGVAILTLATLGPDAQRFDVLWRLALLGLGMGLANTPAVGAAIKAVPTEKVGMASGLSNMSRNLGSVIGVAVMVSVLSGALKTELPTAKQTALEDVRGDSKLLPEVRDQLALALQNLDLAGAQADADRQPGMDQQAVLAKLDEVERAKLAGTPAAFQDQVKAAFATQRTELQTLLPRVSTDFRSAVDRSFAIAFLVAASSLVVVLLTAWFADRRGKDPEDDAEGETVFEPGV